MQPQLSIIVAMASNKAIGYHNALPWHIPEDLAHFKALTTGHTIIMGRRTFLSLPHGPLPNRRNIVVSTTLRQLKDCTVYPSLPDAIDSCAGEKEVFIIGGERLYREALPFVSKLYITHVDRIPAHADAFFPEIDQAEWEETSIEKHDGFSFSTWHRRATSL